MTEFGKALFLRGIRGGVSSAISAMILIVPNSTTSWTELTTWANALALAGIFGAVSGTLLAIEKALRYQEPPTTTIDSLPDEK
jgi:hypothetical protein